jgi:GT2 family glycosyltransferase/SAM-dependent methyltransferase
MNDSPTGNQTVCDLCMSRESEPLYEVRDQHLHTPGRYLLVRCRQCGLIRLEGDRATPFGPASDAAASGADGAYAPHRVAASVARQRFSLRQKLKDAALAASRGYPAPIGAGWIRAAGAILAPIMAHRLGHTPRYLPAGQLLDAGSGASPYVAAMGVLGWRAIGLELDLPVCQQAFQMDGAPRVAGRMEAAPFATGAFDAITMWHALEHTASPRRALEEARRLLRPPAALQADAGGMLMLETPNIQSIQARLFGSAWFHLDAPRHRFHFTPATLRAYLRASGFRQVRLRRLPSSVGIAGSIQSLVNSLTGQRGAGLRESRLLHMLLWPLAALEAWLGYGGCVQITASATPSVIADSGAAVRPAGSPVTLSVIIVSWNCWPDLRRCLASLQPALAGLSSEVIIVDNDSDDATASLVREEFPDARLLQMAANAGFAAAANRGIEASSGSSIWLLNPDTATPQATPGLLIDALNQQPRAGAVGPRILCDDGQIDPLSAREFPTLFSDLLEKCGLPGLSRRVTRIDLNTTTCRAVPLLSGAGMCLRRQALDAVGGLDEEFILYGEDMDLCRRLWASGWEVRYCGAVHLTHTGSACSRQRPEEAGIQAILSMARYLRKHHGPVCAAGYRAANEALSILKVGMFSLASRVAPSQEARGRYRGKARVHRRLLAAWQRETCV